MDLAKRHEGVLLRPTPPPGNGGSVEHFYHFLFDLMLPLFFITEEGGGGTRFEIERRGPFMGWLETAYPGRIALVAEGRGESGAEAELTGMNPQSVQLTSGEMRAFRDRMMRRFGAGDASSAGTVLLVERRAPGPYYTSEQCRVKGGGTLRRSIPNHGELRDALGRAVRDPGAFVNLQLEGVPLDKQMELFGSAEVVVAQHGAALANLVWMREGAAVVELNDEREQNHFRVVAGCRNLRHFTYRTAGPHAAIDCAAFMEWLGGVEALGPWFGFGEGARRDAEGAGHSG